MDKKQIPLIEISDDSSQSSHIQMGIEQWEQLYGSRPESSQNAMDLMSNNQIRMIMNQYAGELIMDQIPSAESIWIQDEVQIVDEPQADEPQADEPQVIEIQDDDEPQVIEIQDEDEPQVIEPQVQQTSELSFSENPFDDVSMASEIQASSSQDSSENLFEDVASEVSGESSSESEQSQVEGDCDVIRDESLSGCSQDYKGGYEQDSFINDESESSHYDEFSSEIKPRKLKKIRRIARRKGKKSSK